MSEFAYNNPEFDNYAANYDAALARGLAVSGEDKEFFAKGRVDWLHGCLDRLRVQPGKILDFGCGVGSSTPFLLDIIGTQELTGVDNSKLSLEVARENFKLRPANFLLLDQYQPDQTMDLAFCNGVFHHILPAERPAAINYIYRSLRGGGLFAFWENNPWNVGTRYVMSRIPFDRDAILLSHLEAQRELKKAGFEILRVDFLFIFPRALHHFRRAERQLSKWPLGAQYQVLCQKP